MPIKRKETLQAVAAFDPGEDGIAAKSKDLVELLLHHGTKPFSPRQYWPGHVTCTALIFHPSDLRVLVIYHHRLSRWLLPGGHVEKTDASLADVAAREALEETHVQLDKSYKPFLVGIDVHGIPPKQREPYHLHHDLIWCFRAAREDFQSTSEALEVRWVEEHQWAKLDLTASIQRSIGRAVPLSKQRAAR